MLSQRCAQRTCRSQLARSTSHRRCHLARFSCRCRLWGGSPTSSSSATSSCAPIRMAATCASATSPARSSVELGSQDYTVNAYLNKAVATAIVIYQRPGSNALTTAAAVKAAMAEAKKDFPSGLDYTVVYNPTEFIQQSINEVERTLFEAIGLVVCVVILFLQTWRAAIIPVVAKPVSLVGCFLVMGLVGISFNTLSLFGLVLASASSWTTRSWWWRTSNGISSRACHRAMRRTRPWTRSAARRSRSLWCCARCSSRPRSSADCKVRSIGSSPSPSPQRRSFPRLSR
jgi:hypothetical protein